MPKTAHTTVRNLGILGAPLSAGAWAIDPRFPLKAALGGLLEAVDKGGPVMQDTDYIRMLKESNGFTVYINPDNSEVHSLDSDADSRILPGATAVVPVHGVMLKSCPSWYQYYGFTSTERATADLAKAGADERVAKVVLNMYTPGGMVYGADALNQTVQKVAATKRVDAYVSDLCASAGVFGIAHATSINLSSRTAEIGSIGTMTTVVNDDKFWEDYGIIFQEVYATDSADKNAPYNEAAQGNPKKLIAELDKFNKVFTSTVAAGRAGKISKMGEVLTGKMYIGQEAIDAGLADGYATLEETIALAAENARATDDQPDPNNPEQRHTPNAMSLTAKLVAFAQSIAAIFAKKDAPTQEEINSANAIIKAEGVTGVQLVTEAQAKGLANVDELQAQLTAAQGQVSALTTERDALQATNATQATALATATGTLATLTEGLTAIATEHQITAAEGQTLEATVIAKAKEWAAKPGAAHANGKTEGAATKTELSPSQKAAEAAGISFGDEEAKA